MCKAHLSNVLTFFVHRLTNGPIEGLNNKIQGLIKKALGIGTKSVSSPTSSSIWVVGPFIPLNEKLPEHS